MRNSHDAQLDLSQLPEDATNARIFPDLAKYSLLSVAKVFDIEEAPRILLPQHAHFAQSCTVADLKPQIPDTPLDEIFLKAVSLDDSFLPYANTVIDPDTGKAMEYKQLIANPKTRATWTHSY